MASVNTPPSSVDAPESGSTRRGDAATPQVGWFDRRLVAAGLAVVAARLVFALDRRVFHLFADEPGQLAMARWLSGGTRWTMLDHNTWRPGYALVLAPFVTVFDSGEAMVRAALTVNAVAAGLTCVVLARLVERWTALGLGASAAIATVTALAPSAIASSAYTWAESLITLALVLTLWFLQRFADDERAVDALSAVAASGLALTTHGRVATVLPTTVVIAVLLLGRRRRWTAAGGVVGLGVILTVASQALNRWVRDAVWDELNDTNTSGAVIERLDDPLALLDAIVGQAWYQLVATAGLAGIGFVTAITAAVRPRPPFDRRSAVVLLATTLPPIAVSIAFMSGRDRPDQLIYGRYLDTLSWPFLALGIAVIVRRLIRGSHLEGRYVVPVTVVTMLVAGLVVWARHRDELADDIGLPMMIPGVLPIVGRGDDVPVIAITLIACALLAAIAALALTVRASTRTRQRVLIVGAIALLGLSAFRIHDALATNLNGWAIGDSVAAMDQIVPDGERIGLITDARSQTANNLEQRQRYQVYQLYLPDHEMVWERDPARPSTRFVVAPLRNPDMLSADAAIVWRDPDKAIALWKLP